MNNDYKGKAKYILASMVMALLITATLAINNKMFFRQEFYKTLTNDTIPASTVKQKPSSKTKPPVNKDSSQNLSNQKKNNIDTTVMPVIDTVPVPAKDSFVSMSIDTFKLKMSKDSLDAPVNYHADDSMVMDIPGKKITLYGKKSSTKYTDNELEAPVIIFDQQTNLVMASLKKDSTGKVVSYPALKQGGSKMISDTILFNMKNGKGVTKGTYTEQGGLFIYGEKMKKINTTDFYAYKARFTTCDLDTPHFSFVSKKIKFMNKKFAVTGPVHPEFEGVPIPVVLPFGIFPLTQGRHSGLLPPRFAANDLYGLGLEDGGYYKVLNDNWDITTRASIYSSGSYTLSINPHYLKRYRYQGSFSFDVNNYINNSKGDPDYSSTKAYQVRWSHSTDSRARPGVSFSANVNAGSSKFNSTVPNNPNVNFKNQLNSSIAYSKVWKDKPYNISLNATHSQNTNTGIISATFPNMTFNLNTLYPFRKKESVGALKWYENIGVALTTNATNATYFTDDTSKSKSSIGTQIFDNMQWGAVQALPISLTLPQIGPIQISPGISYGQKWYQQKLYQTFDSVNNKIDTTITKGIYTAVDMSFSLGLATRIFGSFVFGKNAKIQAIRHEIRPSVSINYKPDLNGGSYYNTRHDTSSSSYYTRSSVYANSLFGPFSDGKFGGISFNIDNNVQMKVRNKSDTGEAAVKKVTLIDGLNFSGSYNFLADSLQLSPLSISGRTNLFNKINITTSASLNPYQVNPANGQLINKFVGGLGRLTSASISISTQFQGGDPSAKKAGAAIRPNQQINPNTGMPLDEYETEQAYITDNPAEFVDFSIPWTLDFSYSLQLSKTYSVSEQSFITNLNQNINWNSSLNITEKWKMLITGYYNLTTKDLGTLTISLAREMHCWQMAINISPVGLYRFFNISISPKSGLLQDLKVNRRTVSTGF
jgi:LPS-assembly protein